LEAQYVLADAGYDSKTTNKAVKAIDAEPIIASNPRRGKRKKIKHATLLRLSVKWLSSLTGISKRMC
jgi:IS5 family transposase